MLRRPKSTGIDRELVSKKLMERGRYEDPDKKGWIHVSIVPAYFICGDCGGSNYESIFVTSAYVVQ